MMIQLLPPLSMPSRQTPPSIYALLIVEAGSSSIRIQQPYTACINALRLLSLFQSWRPCLSQKYVLL
jgi:hypothetical protein